MKDGKILERLVGENVKLRRKIEALQKDTQKIKVYKDMLKNERAKLERLQDRIGRHHDKVRDMKTKVANAVAAERKSTKFVASLKKRVAGLENELKARSSRDEDRGVLVARITKLLGELA